MAGAYTITKRWTGVTTAGQAISFTEPVHGYVISVEGGAQYYVTGSHGESAAALMTGSFAAAGVDVPSGRTICTIASVADTVNVSAIGFR